MGLTHSKSEREEMKILLILSTLISLSFAKLDIAVTYSYIGDITKKIGGELVNINTLSKPKEDPHFVIARPSLIAKIRSVDLLIINGGQIEIGWLPPLIKRANNPKVFDGAEGFLDLSQYIDMIDEHHDISRADGDVHPDGNPHFILDPYNVPIIAKAISNKLSELDPKHSSFYKKNLDKFVTEWNKKLAIWDEKMKPLKGRKVIQYHKSFDYFLKRYNMESLDTIEPIPGISPTSKHIMKLIKEIKGEKSPILIMHDVYHNRKAAKLISEKTNLKILAVPHDVNALKDANNIENFYNTIIDGLLK